MTTAPKGIWLLSYEGTDVSDELAEMATSVEYVDNLTGKSDEISVSLEDRKGRWRSGWFPSAGDRIDLKIGWEGEALLSCGRFKIDEPEISGPPDVISIKGQAAVSAQPVRTVQHRAFEQTTLRDVLKQIGGELKLELVGDVEAIPIARLTQAETTLAFLRRLAESYGYAFSIRDERLIFFHLEKLAAKPAVMKLSRFDLEKYQFKASTTGTYVACELSYFDASIKELRTVRVEEETARQAIFIASGGGGAAAASVPLPTRTLRQGVNGEDVQRWQTFLRAKAFDPGPIDGIFGPKTRAGTMAFQRASGIKVDGVAGTETFRVALDAGYATAAAGVTHAETAGNVLRVTERAESVAQAEMKARAKLQAANRIKGTGSIDIIGRTKLVAGVTIEITDMARFSGKYAVQKSTHRADRSGAYTSSAELTYV
jgi:phage protein D